MGVRSRREKKSYRSKTREPEKTERRRTGDSDWDSIFKKDFSVFKAREGKNTIRIISPNLIIEDPDNPKKEIEVGWVGADHWGMDIYVHNSVGSTFNGYLCPREMKGKPCPICEDRDRATAEKDESEEAVNYIKSLKPQHRVLVYLVDRKSDEPEVQVWSMPRYQMDMAIAKVAYDEDDNSDIPIDSPDEGYNIHFEFGKDKKSGMYGYSGVKLAKSSSEVEDEFLDYVAENPLPDVLQFYSYERIKEVHEGVSDSATDEADDDVEVEESKTDSDSEKSDLTYDKVQDMDEYDLLDILEEDGSIGDDELDEMTEDELKEAVCELFGLYPSTKVESAREKAKKQRKRRRG